MYDTARTPARPPKSIRRPRRWPESRLSGLAPTSALIWRRSRAPNSGKTAKSVVAVTGPTPGTPRPPAFPASRWPPGRSGGGRGRAASRSVRPTRRHLAKPAAAPGPAKSHVQIDLGDVDPDPALGPARGRPCLGGRGLAGVGFLSPRGWRSIQSHRAFGIERGVDRRSDTGFFVMACSLSRPCTMRVLAPATVRASGSPNPSDQRGASGSPTGSWLPRGVSRYHALRNSTKLQTYKG